MSCSSSATVPTVCWRDEVNAVGIDFDNLRASFFEPCDRGLNQLSAFGRDLIGSGEVVEMAHLKAEVAVERVDQDFESRL